MPRLVVVTPYPPSLTETFIRSHIEHLPAEVALVHGWRPRIGSQTVLSFPRLAAYKLWRTVSGSGLERETSAAYLKAFRQHGAQAVLAEYGQTGVQVAPACESAGIPLIVHFHGYDASVRSVLQEHSESYPAMFKKASALIAVSRAMRAKLISIGAPAEKVYYNPYGVDVSRFRLADPVNQPPVILAVGRFTEKKAPHLTLSAFAQVHERLPAARLRMVGDGPLLERCRHLASEMNIEAAVTFLGARSHEEVQKEMTQARCFVQHSIEADSGDSEGTPVAILEAGASGLAVVSTRHAGIPDVVKEGETGFLVDEGDVAGMAQRLVDLLEHPQICAAMGVAAANHIRRNFSKEDRLGRLWRIIEQFIDNSMDGCARNDRVSPDG